MQSKTITSNSNIYIYSILALIAIGFYIVSRFTPLHGDDFNYYFINSPEELRNISPFWNNFRIYTDNFAGVGRFIPHLLVAFFTEITGKAIFNIFSTIGFISLCYLIATYASDNKHSRIYLTIIAAAVTWLSIPGFFEAYLWMAGACNYLFVAIIVLLFYRTLQSDTHQKPAWWSLPLWFVFGFVTGWTNEGFIVGLSGATGIYYVFLHPRQLNRRRISMLSGLWIGTICLCLTPFNLNRFLSGHSEHKSLIEIISQLTNSILALHDIHISLILIAIVAIIFFAQKPLRSRLYTFIHNNQILIIAWAISLTFILLIGYENGNSRTPTEIYALTLLISLISYCLTNKTIFMTAVISGCITIASFLYIIPTCIKNYKTHEDMRQQVQSGKTLIATENIKSNPFLSRYYYPVLLAMYRAPIPQAQYPVKYYGGKQGAYILSTSIVNMMQNWTPDTKFKVDDDLGSLWIKNTGNPNPAKIRLHIRPLSNDEMNFFERKIAPYFGRYSMTEYETDEFVSADILDEHWIVLRNYPYISDRIIDVELLY